MTQHHINNTLFDNTYNEVNRAAVRRADGKTRQHKSLATRMRIGIVAGSALLLGVFALPVANYMQSNIQPQVSTNEYVTSAYTGQTDAGIATGENVQLAPVSAQASYEGIARQAAASAGISPDLFVRQIHKESGFNPNAVSHAGALGIAQFMPGTAAGMGVNPHNPTDALYGAARLMAQLNGQFGGDYAKALAAYNAGPGAVMGATGSAGGGWLSVMPAETQHYVHAILG